MLRRWIQPIVLLAVAALTAVLNGPGPGLIVPALCVVLAVLLSPRAFPRSVTDAEARAAGARDGRPIVYWRPGCPYCARLRVSLGRHARTLHWVDIWQDPAGAASVRAVADGNETVPTVIAGDRSFVNPAPALVKSL